MGQIVVYLKKIQLTEVLYDLDTVRDVVGANLFLEKRVFGGTFDGSGMYRVVKKKRFNSCQMKSAKKLKMASGRQGSFRVAPVCVMLF